MASDDLLSLHKVLNFTGEFVEGKAGDESIIRQLAVKHKAELVVKAKVLTISFDGKDSAIRRWTVSTSSLLSTVR